MMSAGRNTVCGHHDRKHKAKGMCAECYGRRPERQRHNRERMAAKRASNLEAARAYGREYQRKRREHFPLESRRGRRKSLYGPKATEAFDAATICECCREPFTKARSKCIDHDHSKPKGDASFRGILCRPCNSAAGLLRDSHVNARLIAAYLERFDPAICIVGN
jgi:hypothetical protein